MLRKIIVFFTLSLFTFHLSAQIGSWKLYPAYTYCSYNEPVGHRIYSIMEGKLMAYDTDDGSITTFDWLEQLSDVSVSFIRYCADAKRIVVVYDNGNIDLLSVEDDFDVINLAQLKNSTMASKEVNNIQVYGHNAYICTSFGLVVVDVSEGFIRDSYELGISVTACALSETSLFIASTPGLWRGTLTDNLKDKANWTLINANIRVQHMESMGGRIYFHAGTYLLMINDKENGWIELQSNTLNPSPAYMTVSNNKLIIGNSNSVYIYESKDSYTKVSGDFSWNCLTYKDNEYWASDGAEGLQAYRLNGTQFDLSRPSIHPNSPLHDYSFHLRFSGDNLMVSGGNRHYSEVSRVGTAMILDQDGTWHNFNSQSVNQLYPKENWKDVTNIAQDPQDANSYYVGTTRSGIFKFSGEKCVGHIGLENSPLKSILPDNANPQWFVVADGLQYDNDGNMWVLNCTQGAQDTTIRIRRPNGTWTGIPCPEIKDASTVDNIFFDSRGYAWLNSRRMTQRGVFLLDYNGTIAESRDDRRKLSTTIVNQDGTSYTPDEFYYINEDVDGSIWVCTNLGPFHITDPESFFSQDFTYEQVKVARNDGSGLADYLLSGLTTQCVAFDGAGRKWFGTANNGVYLVSEDCQEELAHYTTENSPLPSDNIYDIAIHPSTGRVFFATDKGLCSFLSDATEPADGLEKDNIYAFPNPVEPDYYGPIGIRGLVKNSEVKILSSTGQLIWSGVSNGGTITWNGCNRFGARVASGVYVVLVNTPDGKDAASTKITFIR